MTHAIKQIADSDGEPMMEVVVHSDCSAVDMEAIHAEALEMNKELDAEFASIDELAPDDNAKARFKAIASKYVVGCVMGVNAAHAEALEFNNAYKTLYVYAPGDAARDVWPHLTEIERIVSVEFAHKQALYENQQDDDAIEYLAAYGSRLNLEAFTQHQIKRIADFCHSDALELNNAIDDGRTMDMYHKWNTAPTAQIRRDMLAAAHSEALKMNASYA